MRRRIRAALGHVTYDRFLVYLMGPYKTFNPEDLLPKGADPETLPTPFRWRDEEGSYTHGEVVALLRQVQGALRVTPGANAFLAIDIDIPLNELDAATQSIEFARASNAIVFVIPFVGKNLGVGIEVGSVLTDLDDTDRERILFVHEAGVRSAMIQGVARRWDADVQPYADVEDLVTRVRHFIAATMTRELDGDLPQKTK